MLTYFKVSKIIFKAILLLTIILVTITNAQECDECSHPRVSFYDCDVQTPDTLNNWAVYWFPAAVAKSYIRNNDPSRDCMTFLDAGVINAQTLQNGTLKYGAGYANLAPAGPIESVDYLFTSTVRKNGNVCTFTLQLETSVSREVVKSVSVNFTADSLSDVVAGENAAQSFVPLFETIRNYEINKRNTNTDVAIRDMMPDVPQPEIKLTPAKQKLAPEESTDIEVQMVDCDGVALGNRTIFFVDTTVNDINFPGTTDGKIEPKVVTTDAAGMATVKFTAGKNLGLAQIQASYPHFKPCGRASGFMGNTTVYIGERPKDQWVVHAAFSEQYDRVIDSNATLPNGSYTFYVADKRKGSATMTGIIDDQQSDSTFYFACFEEYDCPLDNFKVSGFGTQSYYKKYWLQANGLNFPDAEMRSESYTGHAIQGSSGFQFQYPLKPGDIAIVAQVGGPSYGSISGKSTFCCPFEWNDLSGSVSTSFSVSVDFNEDQCTVTKSDSGYSICGNRTSVTKSGPETITRVISLTATIIKNGSITGIEKDNSKPANHFVLDQNYPNPFNPTTIIRYNIPASSYVELKLYDMLGREVKTVVNEQQRAGAHSVKVNGSDLAAGVYFYRLVAGTFSSTKKLVLMK